MQRSLLKQKNGVSTRIYQKKPNRFRGEVKLQLPSAKVLKQLFDRCCKAKKTRGFSSEAGFVYGGAEGELSLQSYYLHCSEKTFVCKIRKQSNIV